MKPIKKNKVSDKNVTRKQAKKAKAKKRILVSRSLAAKKAWRTMKKDKTYIKVEGSYQYNGDKRNAFSRSQPVAKAIGRARPQAKVEDLKQQLLTLIKESELQKVVNQTSGNTQPVPVSPKRTSIFNIFKRA